MNLWQSKVSVPGKSSAGTTHLFFKKDDYAIFYHKIEAVSKAGSISLLSNQFGQIKYSDDIIFSILTSK